MTEKRFTRRDFVLKSATGVGGIAVAGYAAQAATLEEKMGNATLNNSKVHQPDHPVVFEENDVVIENDQMRLVIGANAIVKSLLYKPSGEECLVRGKDIPISTMVQRRPFQNEVKLAYPNEEMTFKANAVRKEGNRLTISYELIPDSIVVAVNIRTQYIEFKIEDLIADQEGYGGVLIASPPATRIWFLQLPLRKRKNYGDLLQVVWDEKIASNLLSTDPYARITAEETDEAYILKAGAEREIKLKGTSAALITCATDKLLDNIEQLENDFNLSPGVKSRRSKAYSYSYYWTADIHPGNLQKHLKYAKMGGFRAMSIYYPAFLKSRGYRLIGDYDWDTSLYPNGKEDLRLLLNKIKAEDIVPGFHFLHSFIGLDSKYVTPVPDRRLNLVKLFTLAAPLKKGDTTIVVDQDPSTIEMAKGRRVLKIENELVSYEGYSHSRPYQITGCVRGAFNTTVEDHPLGTMLGVLDVSEFGAQSVYINQDNDLQDEMAEKIANIYDAGFQFCYYDGSEGVNAPFWCNVSRAQWRVHKRLNPQPLFAEGAAKTHFSWHMLSRGNAFDVFRPEVLKEEIRKHPAAEAPRMKQNFTHINFGWLGYWVPDEKTVGTQPDMLEYVASRAAAWDCPISIQTNLKLFDAHPRTPDNFEVMRRWEEVRVNNWLTPEQKLLLQKLEQEHILLINEKNEFELQPYDQIINVADSNREVRAFVFERSGSLYVVYWHISGDKKLELPLKAKNVTVSESLQKKTNVSVSKRENTITIPVGKRRYIKTNGITKEEIIAAFQQARIW